MKVTASILITTTTAMLLSVFAAGQSIGINTAGNPPHSSSVLDVASITQGVLTPRMTEVQRIAITNPATGLLIYQTDVRPGFRFYDGTEWVFLRGVTSIPGRVEVSSGCTEAVTTPSAFSGFAVNYNCATGVGEVTWPAGYFDTNPIVNLSSSEVQVPPPAPDIYCTPVYFAPCDTWLNADQIEGVRIDHSTAGATGPWTALFDRPSMCFDPDNGNYENVLPSEATATLQGNTGGCGTNHYRVSIKSSDEWTDWVQAYIDWNADGDFFDAQEAIGGGSWGFSSGNYVNSPVFTVPNFALNGNTVMRCRSLWVNSNNPCQGAQYGETEDYTLTIDCATSGPAPEIACICTVTEVTNTSFDYKCTLLSGAPADPYLVNFELLPTDE